MSWETAASHVPARTPGERVIAADPDVERDATRRRRRRRATRARRPRRRGSPRRPRCRGRSATVGGAAGARTGSRDARRRSRSCPTVDTAGPRRVGVANGRDDPGRPIRTQRAGRSLGVLPVGEEAVDAGAGAAHVGAERACARAAARQRATTRDRSAGAGRGRGSPDSRERVERASPDASAKPAAPSRASKAR